MYGIGLFKKMAIAQDAWMRCHFLCWGGEGVRERGVCWRVRRIQIFWMDESLCLVSRVRSFTLPRHICSLPLRHPPPHHPCSVAIEAPPTIHVLWLLVVPVTTIITTPHPPLDKFLSCKKNVCFLQASGVCPDISLVSGCLIHTQKYRIQLVAAHDFSVVCDWPVPIAAIEASDPSSHNTAILQRTSSRCDWSPLSLWKGCPHQTRVGNLSTQFRMNTNSWA